MIFNVMTIIVFIAELIIAYSLIKLLFEFDRFILQTNETITEIKPGLKDVGYLIKKISAQCVDFAYNFAAEIKAKTDDSIISQLNKLLIALFILKLNSKFIRKILRSKHFKLLSKGFSLLKYMV